MLMNVTGVTYGQRLKCADRARILEAGFATMSSHLQNTGEKDYSFFG